MKLRRMLSVVLAAAIIATGIGPIEAIADEEAVPLEQSTSANDYILKEKRYLASKNYGGFFGVIDEGIGVRWSNAEGILSTAEIAKKKYVNLAKQPNTTYTVIASSETQYNFKVRYYTASSKPGKLAMLVNDDYANIIPQGETTTDDSGYYYASFSPTLKKGQNVIRILVVKNEDQKNWCDLYDMQADKRVTVNEEYESLRPDTDKTDSKNWTIRSKDGWAVDTGKNMSDIGMKDVTYDTYTIAADSPSYTNMPSISFTVVAPRSGYYDISQNFEMEGLEGQSGKKDQDAKVRCYTILCVDGGGATDTAVGAKKQKCYFDSSCGGRVNTTTYLSQGTHTLTFTAAIAEDSDANCGKIDIYEDGNNNKYPTWFNVKSVELYGGLKKAETADNIDPTSIPEGYIVDNTDKRYKASYNCGGFGDTSGTEEKLDRMNTDGIISTEAIQKAGYLNRDARPNTSYSVKAPSAGDYYFAIRYDTGAGNTITANHMAISVNDETYYTSEGIVSEITGESTPTTKAYSAKFCVSLQEGMNVLRFLPAPDGTTTYSYDLYYMTADSRVTVSNNELVPGTSMLTPENAGAESIVNWTKDSAGSKMTDTGKYVGTAAAAGVNFYNYGTVKGNFGTMPSLSFTVTAPEDGYYDISQAYTTLLGDGEPCYMILRVDGVNYMRGFDRQESSKVNTSVYLSAGTHTLTFTSAIRMGGTSSQTHKPTLLEAEKAFLHNYDTPQDGATMVGGATGWVTVEYNILRQKTDDEIKGYLENNSYVAYTIDSVPSDGYYPVKVRYQLDGGTANNLPNRNEHHIYLYANGKAYQLPFQSDGEASDTTSISTAYIKLKAGKNTVYSIPFDETYFNTHGKDDNGQWRSPWINQDYLEVDLQSCRVEAEDCIDTTSTYNYSSKELTGAAYGNETYVVGNPNYGYIKSNSLTYENLSKCPDIDTYLTTNHFAHVAYSITKVPSDGYYPVSVRYVLDGTGYNSSETRKRHEILLYANGNAYKAKFQEESAESATGIATTYVKLNEGYNTVYCIPFESTSYQEGASVKQDYLEVDLQNIDNKEYLESYDVDEIKLYGGLTLAKTQADPGQINDVTRLGASTSGITWRYNEKNMPSIDDQSYRVGNIDLVGCNELFQSFQDMSDIKWVEKSNLPSVSYIVNVPEAGEYFVRSVYTSEWKTGVDYLKYFMAVSVNDEQFAKAYFHPALPNNPQDSVSDVKVHLDKGYNVIRMISLVSETKDIVEWLDQDYIEIYGGSGTVTINSDGNAVTHLQPTESQFYNRYSKRNVTDANPVGWATEYWGEVQWTQVPVTCESFERDLSLLKALPYVSYTVNVPENGFYDLQTYTEHGGVLRDYLVLIDIKEEEGRPYSVYNMPVTQKTYPQRLDQNAQNLSVKLTAGKHTLVLTSILEMNSHEDVRWSNMASVTISGGITKADSQIDPLSGVSVTYKAPKKGLVDGSCYTADGSNNIAGVPFGTTVQTLKSNFCVTDQITIRTKDGVAVNDTDLVTPGMRVIYNDDNTTYIVPNLIGDLTADGNIDLRDLVDAVKCAGGTISGKDSIGDINKEDASGKINDKDIDEYCKVLLGKSDVLKYQETSIGADVISLLGVNLESKTESSVFMKNQNSYFTIQGNFQGDVYLTLYPYLGGGTEMSITVDIDGNPTSIPLIRPYQLMKLKIADNLSKGSHTIKVSKNTGADADNLYITSVQFTGEWTSQN